MALPNYTINELNNFMESDDISFMNIEENESIFTNFKQFGRNFSNLSKYLSKLKAYIRLLKVNESNTPLKYVFEFTNISNSTNTVNKNGSDFVLSIQNASTSTPILTITSNNPDLDLREAIWKINCKDLTATYQNYSGTLYEIVTQSYIKIKLTNAFKSNVTNGFNIVMIL